MKFGQVSLAAMKEDQLYQFTYQVTSAVCVKMVLAHAHSLPQGEPSCGVKTQTL